MSGPRPFLIGGQWRSSEDLSVVQFPYNNETVAEVCQASERDLEDAVLSSVKGFELTRKLSTQARSEILENLLAQIENRTDEMIETIIIEGGKTHKVAAAETERAKETVRISAEEAKRIDGEIINLDWTKAGEKRQGYIRHFPLGPVLGIAPFNYPLNLSCHKLAPAIAAGNSFILKPASSTPLSGLLLAEMTLEAGYPPEALSVVVCPGSKAEKLASDPRISFLTFTGSAEVGWHLKGLCGRKRVGLELGGNAAVIIHEDANLDYATRRIALSGFTNSGQNCISAQRVLLHRSIYDQTVSMMLERIGALKVGDPRDPDTDVGPMISEGAARASFQIVQQAVEQGAEILLGGVCQGAMFHPTVLGNTTPAMPVNREEIFAPVITVSPYDDFEEAIRRANDTDYGLQSGLFTQNINRIMQAFEEIRVGGLLINDASTFRVDQMPHGGVKGSGIGREGPRYAIREMTEARLMVINLPGGSP